MDFTTDHLPTYKEYVMNIEEKLKDSEFAGDTAQLIDSSMVFNPEEAYRLVKEMLIDKLPGERWEE